LTRGPAFYTSLKSIIVQWVAHCLRLRRQQVLSERFHIQPTYFYTRDWIMRAIVGVMQAAT
jgi:hypothetical protein